MITLQAADRCRTLCRVLASLEAVAEIRCFAEHEIPADLAARTATVKQLLATI